MLENYTSFLATAGVLTGKISVLIVAFATLSMESASLSEKHKISIHGELQNLTNNCTDHRKIIWGTYYIFLRSRDIDSVWALSVEIETCRAEKKADRPQCRSRRPCRTWWSVSSDFHGTVNFGNHNKCTRHAD